VTVHVEIERLRLSGVELPAQGADGLRGELERAIAAELAPIAATGAPIAADQIAAGVRRVVNATVDRRAG
jgi:hypothetical protein